MEFKSGKRSFTQTEVIGTVADANKLTTQETYVSGGGGWSYQGSGGVAPISVATSSTIHDTVFLVDRDGREFTLKLSNVDIAVRPGHELHCVWAARQGGSQALVGIFDRSTRETVWLDANLNKLFRLTRPLWKGLSIAFFAGLVIAVLGAVLVLPLAFPILLPYLLWRHDRTASAAVARLKAVISEGFQTRAEEGLRPAENPG